MNIPEYPTIVKRPMDLSTVRSNLLEGAYDEPSEVNSDVKLMLRNCFAFNPPGTAVYDAGKMVESYWQGRWRMLPPLQAESDEEPEVEEPDSAEEGASLSSPHSENMRFQRLTPSLVSSPFGRDQPAHGPDGGPPEEARRRSRSTGQEEGGQKGIGTDPVVEAQGAQAGRSQAVVRRSLYVFARPRSAQA